MATAKELRRIALSLEGTWRRFAEASELTVSIKPAFTAWRRIARC